jgi:predicted NBD/HSP70 family sugar kinase
MSRSLLAEQTGLNRSTIRDLIAELSGLGLVDEDRGTTSQRPGRPSSVARPLPSGAVVLAVELEVDSTAVATVGLGGHIFEMTRVANPSGGNTPEETTTKLAELSSSLIASLPVDHVVVGVGVAVAGVVRRSDGFVHVAPNLGWLNVPLGEMISARLGLQRVMMANEADLGALAEHRRGAAKGSRHLLYVAGEVGVGIGIIHDGKPMLGTAGYAGEAGHTIVNPAGRRCRCGSIGCWETEVGEEALARRAGLGGMDERKGLIEEVVRRAHAGDTRTFAALDEVGTWLGVGIGNLINTFNPDLVVIGGVYGQLFPFIEKSVTRGAHETALTAPWETCSILRSGLGVDGPLIGAAELVLAEVIANPNRFRVPVEDGQILDLMGTTGGQPPSHRAAPS